MSAKERKRLVAELLKLDGELAEDPLDEPEPEPEPESEPASPKVKAKAVAKAVAKEAKKNEIAGASEPTIQALLQEVRGLRTDLSGGADRASIVKRFTSIFTAIFGEEEE